MTMYARPHTRQRQTPATYRRGHPSLALAVVGVGLILLGVLVGWLLLRDWSPPVARIGAPMPDFTLPSLSGDTVHLGDFQGQVVIVNAWATYCPPCRAEMPAFQAFYRAHQAQGFQLLAVNAGEARQAVAGFIGQMGFTFPVLLDPGQVALDRIGLRGLPTSYVIGRDGLVKDIHIGEFTPQDLEAQVAPLLSQGSAASG